LEDYELNLSKVAKKPKKNPDEPIDGDDLVPLGDDRVDYGPAQDDHLAQHNNLPIDDDEADDYSLEDGTGGTEERPDAATRRHKSGKKKDRGDKKDRKKSKKRKRDKEGRR